MSTLTEKPPFALTVEIPGKQRAIELNDPSVKYAVRRGFYPNEGVIVGVHNHFAQAGSEVQLILNDHVVATYIVKAEETGNAIPFRVSAEQLPCGAHLLRIQIKQSGAVMRQGTHQAMVRVKSMPLSHFGVDVTAEDDRHYASIDVSLESCVGVQQTADDLFHFFGGYEPALFSPDEEFIYVSGDDIKKIETKTHKVIKTYNVGGMRFGGFSSNQSSLYLTSWSFPDIYVLDLCEGSSKPVIEIGRMSSGLVVSHDGEQLFAVARVPWGVESSLLVVDAQSQEIVEKIEVGLVSNSIVLNPFREEVYVGCLGQQGKKEGVFLVNTTTYKVTHLPVKNPWSMVLSSNGEELYVFGEDRVTVIDTVNNGIKGVFNVYAELLTVSADGKLVYCCNSQQSFISVYESQGFKFIRNVEIPMNNVRALSTQKSDGGIWVIYG
ncbi:hypothetical protein ACIOZM_29605 [Pseudomonas sp. NPDC087346]|uniref:hypothetical protein n=1 Tax=Pseudomonas sp. NPDC087346 TaxID=3364438 RepID=UPI00381829AC